ncbi:hypothetical protein, partial [Lactiplantibacillus songbeiensis]
ESLGAGYLRSFYPLSEHLRLCSNFWGTPQLWLQNGPWRSSVLGTNRQAAISTGAKRKLMVDYF